MTSDIVVDSGPTYNQGVTSSTPISFSTTQTNTILVLYIVNATVSSVTASGLTFAIRGDSSMWWAYSPAILTNKSITVASDGTAVVIATAFALVNTLAPWDTNSALPSTLSTPSITTTGPVTMAVAWYVVDTTTFGTNGFSTLYSANNFMVIAQALETPVSGLLASIGGSPGTVYAARGDALVAPIIQASYPIYMRSP